jgi:hypothetical protein
MLFSCVLRQDARVVAVPQKEYTEKVGMVQWWLKSH